MPVRVVIHSSDVSRNVERSSLLRMDGGSPSPQPVMAAHGMGNSRRSRKSAGRSEKLQREARGKYLAGGRA